jgi:hypothetical protein
LKFQIYFKVQIERQIEIYLKEKIQNLKSTNQQNNFIEIKEVDDLEVFNECVEKEVLGELDYYLGMKLCQCDLDNPYNFWIKNKNLLPNLLTIA